MNADAAPTEAGPSGAVVINLADADSKPVVLTSVRPDYPADLRKAGIEGHAVVDFVVDPQGIPTRIHVVHQTNPEFGVAAVASMAQWRFSPGRKNGAPAWVHIQIPMIFSLPSVKADSQPIPPMADLGPGQPVFEVSRVDTAPLAVYQSRPQYPPALKARGTSGRVLISFVVRINGGVSNVMVLEATDPLFGAAGVEAVRHWRFHPARVGGHPVNCQLKVPLVFSLAP